MDFGPRKNTEREIEEVVKEAKRYKQEDAIEKKRLTAKFNLQVMIEQEKYSVKEKHYVSFKFFHLCYLIS